MAARVTPLDDGPVSLDEPIGEMPAFTVIIDPGARVGAVMFKGHEVYRSKYPPNHADPDAFLEARFAARLYRLMMSDL